MGRAKVFTQVWAQGLGQLGSYPSYNYERRVASEVIDHIRTVVFHRFVGADEAKLEEQGRTTKMTQTAVETWKHRREPAPVLARALSGCMAGCW